MDNSEFQHSEAFLQWIWENLLFDFTSLQTTCGKSLRISDPGKLNSTDGPDFKQAVIEVGDITWHGNVEIHVRSEGWVNHGHHEDPNFNTVVLHVFTDDEGIPAQTQNGSTPYSLNLRPYLSKELRFFLKSFEQPSGLPCASGLSFISEEAFHDQIEKAHLEYFEKKSNDFLQFYDPELLPSKAWKKALIISLWDGLGITHNREAMRETAKRFLQSMPGFSADEGETRNALDIAGFEANSSDIRWNLKSVRPASHPINRIKEAVKLTSLVVNEPLENILSLKATEKWDDWVQKASLTNSSRIEILFGTVFLPSLYVLGNLFAHQSLSQKVLSEWRVLKTPIPPSLLKRFHTLKLNTTSYRKKLGAIHQLKSYCGPVRCSECFVLKNAIES
ncbi:MAG: DUF2851 family protein [Gracilimonas sp.]